MEERMMDVIVEIYNHVDEGDKDAFTLEDAEDMVADQIKMDKEEGREPLAYDPQFFYDIVTDALTAFGMSALDSGYFADILAVTSSKANTNVSMMGETFKYCASIASALGFSAEETAEVIDLMDEKQVATEIDKIHLEYSS